MRRMTPPLHSQTTAALSHPDEPQQLFHCRMCKQSFRRLNNLARHFRKHTCPGSFVCPVCSKGFTRKDALKRHAACHDSRVVQACEACSKSHLRCEDEQPCTRCGKKSIPSQVPDAAINNVSGLDAVHAAQDPLDLSNGADPPSTPSIPNDSLHQSLTPRTWVSETREYFDHSSSTSSANAHDIAPQPGFDGRGRSSTVSNIILPPSDPEDGELPSFGSTLPHFDDSPSMDPFLPNYFRNMPQLESYLSGQATPRGIMGLSFDLDVGLTDLDLRLLEQYNFQAPFAATTPSTDAQEATEQLPETDGVPVRAEAFKQSIWRYLPQRSRDHGAAEQPNLAPSDLESDNNGHSNVAHRRAIAERLNRVSRDRLIALVLRTCSPENVKRIASAFPSIELLDGLIQYFFSSPSIDAQYWFHLPTFSPSKTSPELLASIVAAAAASTPDTPLRKLGFALHEASRKGQSSAFEEVNSAIRDLHHVRTLCVQLEVGLWSGISRKMEISESFVQTIVTILRRGGRFRRSTWKEISPVTEDHGVVLENKWHEWVHQESYLRLMYRAFELDRQSSMALLKPPLISYAEMQLPLPSSNTLWHANSATAWKSAFLNIIHPIAKRPSAIDCFLDLGSLAHYDSACTTYLYMVWGLVWEYRQVSTLTSKPILKANSGHIASSLYVELVKRFIDFQFSIPSLSKSHEITMELMLLHLNAPLADIQLFAGIEGQEEARTAYYVLRDWINTVLARQALWRAGLILRAAESLPRALLCNFNAIAVYHAGLTLWAYGFLKRNSSVIPTCSDGPQPVVVLNGDDSLAAQRFITLNDSVPSIRSPSSQNTTHLSDVVGIMDGLVHLLRGPHDAAEGSCPPLVENLVQLLEGLRSATSKNLIAHRSSLHVYGTLFRGHK